MDDRHDSVVANDEEARSTGSTDPVELNGKPAAKKCKVSRLFALARNRLMDVPLRPHFGIMIGMIIGTGGAGGLIIPSLFTTRTPLFLMASNKRSVAAVSIYPPSSMEALSAICRRSSINWSWLVRKNE